ncbi:MAG: hypothetical protein ACXADY_27025 [Candidatus Hodarchaeales archaeon]
METYTTIEGLLTALIKKLEADNAPFYEGTIGEWLDKYSEVDLKITENGPVEVHNELYRGNRYEITIYTRAFKDDETRGRFE